MIESSFIELFFLFQGVHMINFYPNIKAANHIEFSKDSLEVTTQWLHNKYGYQGYLVHTCTAALEIAALALGLNSDDEVIMPSYTFASTANAFALRGCKIVFVDVDENMNIDLKAVEKAITQNTKAIVPVHYGGSSCHMDHLMMLANKYNIFVIEDAAQSIGCQFNGKYLGSFGHIACMSFHHTKNVHCGEGGMVIINDLTLKDKVEEIIFYGTNRAAFTQGKVSHYSWQGIGTSGLMDPYRAKILYDNLQSVDLITEKRLERLAYYREELKDYPIFRSDNTLENGHIFFIRTKDEYQRSCLSNVLKDHGIVSLSHYEPLHKSMFGKRYKFVAHKGCTSYASSLLRLPIHEDMTMVDIKRVCDTIKRFYE